MTQTGIRRASSIRFGTDGWRAVIGDEFTFANLERVAQAYADFIKSQIDFHSSGSTGASVKNFSSSPLIIIGYDHRFLSEQFARRAAEVLAGNNLRVALFDRAVPTPLVSWTVCDAKAAGGVVITASHNPPEFNGFKIKADWGGSASGKITRQVESLIDAAAPRRTDISTYNLSEITLAAEASYRARIASFVDLERLRAAKIKVVADAMHGTGGDWTASFLEKGNIEIETIRARRDAFFGGVNPEPIDGNLSALKTRVRRHRAILGLATDGDADRLGAVNERGETMTMQQIAPLLLLHLIRQRKMSGGVVTTSSQSVLTKKIAAAYNLPLFETPIGFKYIAELMLAENILIGAEESGGIGLQGHIPERDGILSSLLLLEAIAAAGKPPSEIVREIHAEFGEFYFDRSDLKMEVSKGQDLVAALAENPPAEIAGERVNAVETLDGTKLTFNDESWLLFRQSGTESVLRVYTEATSIDKAAKLLQAGHRIAHNGNRI